MGGWAFFPDPIPLIKKKTPVAFQSHRSTMFKKYDINQNIIWRIYEGCAWQVSN